MSRRVLSASNTCNVVRRGSHGHVLTLILPPLLLSGWYYLSFLLESRPRNKDVVTRDHPTSALILPLHYFLCPIAVLPSARASIHHIDSHQIARFARSSSTPKSPMAQCTRLPELTLTKRRSLWSLVGGKSG